MPPNPVPKSSLLLIYLLRDYLFFNHYHTPKMVRIAALRSAVNGVAASRASVRTMASSSSESLH